MVLLLDKYKILNWCFLNLKLKYNISKNLYFLGKYGFSKLLLSLEKKINLFFFKEKFNNLWFELNTGFIGFLYLNGIGFKCTKKFFNITKKWWRFNVGHSQVFLYFTPKKIIMKVKQRFLCLFGLKKSRIYDIAYQIKNFRIPDIYKGIGIKYPDEIISLKRGKVRQ